MGGPRLKGYENTGKSIYLSLSKTWNLSSYLFLRTKPVIQTYVYSFNRIIFFSVLTIYLFIYWRLKRYSFLSAMLKVEVKTSISPSLPTGAMYFKKFI